MRDSHESGRPVAAATRPRVGSRRPTMPTTVLKIGASWALRASISAWMSGFGVTPTVQGLWKSAVE